MSEQLPAPNEGLAPLPTFKGADWSEHVETAQGVIEGWANEREFKDHLQALFEDRGFRVKRESASPYGVLDLMAYVRSGMLSQADYQIVEAKMSAKPGPLAHALGQLLLYGAAWPRAQLWFACPEQPKPFLVEVLEKHGIGLLQWERSDTMPIARIRSL